jgi:hypothetical protein
MNLEKAVTRGDAETRRMKSSCYGRLWFSPHDCFFSANSAAPREKLRLLR